MTRFLIAVLIALPLFAQDDVPALRPLPVGDVLLSLPSNGADNKNRGRGPSRAQGDAARGQAVL